MHDPSSGHQQCHSHHHHHDHGATGAESGQDRDIALLSYLVNHNRSHTDELQELASRLDGSVADLINEAVALYKEGNAKLEEACALLKEE